MNHAAEANTSAADSLPPLTVRASEGVEAESVVERAHYYRARGVPSDAAMDRAVEDALDTLEELEMEQDAEQIADNTGNKTQ